MSTCFSDLILQCITVISEVTANSSVLLFRTAPKSQPHFASTAKQGILGS